MTFLFTDVEESTRLLDELGAERYAEVLAAHREVVRRGVASHGGVEVDTQGDSFFVAFGTAPAAVAAAEWICERLADGQPIRLRSGLHTGTPILAGEGYVGIDVHKAARIAAAGHGGQVLVSSATAALLDGLADLVDLGAHRFKDLSAPEHVFQLGEGEFPPLRSLHRTNLPVPSTPFLGREQEQAEVAALLRRSDVRLLTLTGPGGTGKTRLALQAVAEASDDRPDGVWWVPLAALRDPALVLPALARTLDVPEEAGPSLLDSFAAMLENRHPLVLLDNAEQLLPRLAHDLADLVAACPTLELVVTSRERLQIAAEITWAVPPLTASDAERLFVERAGAVGVTVPVDASVSELCRQLDDLPLAVELAAARTVVFTPAQLLERLSSRLDLLKGGRDTDPRQQTLRATIDWSYNLLENEEQRVFRALGAFRGGCTLEAAEIVAGADPDALQSLIDKSLLRRRDTELAPRYWFLETIRDYAGEQLDLVGEANAVRRQLAAWCAELAERVVGVPGPNVERQAGPRETAHFQDELDNARSAIDWAWANGEDELGLRLGSACSRIWTSSGLLHDARTWLADADTRIAAASPRVRLNALKVAGIVAFYVVVDPEAADAYWSQARAVAEELGARDEVAWIDNGRAGVAWARGDVELALRWHQELLGEFRANGDRVSEGDALHYIGDALRDLGRFDEAERLLLEADDLYRDVDSPVARSSNIHSIGDLELDRGDAERAIACYRASLALQPGSQRTLAYGLAGIASALADSGRDETAGRLWGAVCAAEQKLGFRMIEAERRRYEQRLDRLEHTPEWESGRSLSLVEALATLDAALD